LLLLTPQKESSTPRYALDDQTERLYKCEPEESEDTIAAFFSIVYLLVVLAFLCWLLFDTWSGNFYFFRLLGYPNIARLKTTSFRLAAYAIVGGGLGSAINSIRSFKVWHCDRFAFGRRFFWKHKVDPIVGSILGLFVYALLRGGVALLGSDIAAGEISTPQGVTIFAIGALTGYSSRKVLLWLDEQANRAFKISEKTTTKVPNLEGESLEDATAMLKAHGLAARVEKGDSNKMNRRTRVISQKPLAESLIAKGKPVEVTVITTKV
jgi:hypothetical protein